MKKILILTSVIVAAATTGMFADEPAPMPSLNIPASPAPAAPAAPAQTQNTSPAKGKHKGKKHRKHAKKNEQKKANTDTAAGTK